MCVDADTELRRHGVTDKCRMQSNTSCDLLATILGHRGPPRDNTNNTVQLHTNTHTHTHPFNGPFSETIRVSRYQKGKTNLDFTEARDSEWQWHQLGHMQICPSLKTNNHASTPPLSFFTGRMPFLPPNQQCQSTEGIQLHTKTWTNQRRCLQ